MEDPKSPLTSAPVPHNGQSAQRVNEWATRTPAGRRPVSGGVIAAVVALSLVLVGIIAVAFRGSWTAHRDAALAAHFDATGAALYPFAPDGLILIALIAAMVLRHDRRARLYALSVVGVFTFTSFIVNHLHGLGTFAPDGVSGQTPILAWPVVALIAGQVIGAIFFGSHLIVSSLRYLFPSTGPDQPGQVSTPPVDGAFPQEASTTRPGPQEADEPVIVHADPDPHDIARIVYGIALDLGVKVGRDKLASACQISTRQAGRIRSDVESDREEEAARQEAEAAAEKKASEVLAALHAPELAPAPDVELSLNGSGPRAIEPAK